MFKAMGIFFILGIIMLAIANIGGIGYGLYLWGGTGMAFALAAWTAFRFWLIWIGLGLVSLAIGYFGM